MSVEKAIKQHCMFCSNGSSVEIAKCPSTWCSLHQFRGDASNEDNDQKIRLIAIRNYCLGRCKDTPKEVKDCNDTTCKLYAHRFGKKIRTK